jgi:hypothetical protein
MFRKKQTTYNEFYELAKFPLGLLTSEELSKAPYTEWKDKPFKAIIFYYNVADIFNEVKKRTAYLAKYRSGEQNLIDVINITADEEDLFEPFLGEVIEEIAERLQSCSNNVIPSYIDRTSVGSVEDLERPYREDNFSFIVCEYEWMIPNGQPMTDKRIFEALASGIMSKWLTLVYPPEAQYYMAVYAENMQKLSAALNTTGQGLKRKYTYF